MAKRDRDTAIWKDKFYRSLPPLYKCFWDFINDECDNAGVWVVDLIGAKLYIGKKINPDKALELFADRVQVFDAGNKWHIKTFLSEKLSFTSDLNPAHKFQKSIIDLLSKHKIEKIKGYPDPLQRVKEREGQEKGKGSEGLEGVQGEILPTPTVHQPIPEAWFACIFDEMYLEGLVMAYRGIDISDQLQKFKTKVRGSPDDYRHRDTGGVRQAFEYQLRQCKPSFKNSQTKREVTLDELKAKR